MLTIRDMLRAGAVLCSPPMTHLQHCACDSGARFLHETTREAMDFDMHGDISAVSHGNLAVATYG